MRINGQTDYYIAAQALKLHNSEQAGVSANVSEGRSAAETTAVRPQPPVAQYIPENGGGVIQTRLSPESSYQKSKIEGSRSEIEDMAARLMDKLPEIFRDMRKLPVEGAETAENSRVVVTERNAAAVAQKNIQQAEEPLMNFSL